LRDNSCNHFFPPVRYTPYFFDKSILDNILEESVDQHFDALIQTRHVQRRRDVIDDNLAAEVIEESADSIWEPTEVSLNLIFALFITRRRKKLNYLWYP